MDRHNFDSDVQVYCKAKYKKNIKKELINKSCLGHLPAKFPCNYFEINVCKCLFCM